MTKLRKLSKGKRNGLCMYLDYVFAFFHASVFSAQTVNELNNGP